MLANRVLFRRSYQAQFIYYLSWQVRQIKLPVLVTRKKVGLNTEPGPAEGTPCGSWHDAHSTSGPPPVSYRRTSALSIFPFPLVSKYRVVPFIPLGVLKSVPGPLVDGKVMPTGWSSVRSVLRAKAVKSVAPMPNLWQPKQLVAAVDGNDKVPCSMAFCPLRLFHVSRKASFWAVIEATS